MKNAVNMFGAFLLAALVVGSVSAQPKARKLTADAYLKTAKIEMTHDDTARYAYAEVMLDSLFMYYGPYAEGYYWIAKMNVAKNEQVGDLKKKKFYITNLAVYDDSLRALCADSKAKPNNKKGCDKFLSEIDSIRVHTYWTRYYNEGCAQYKLVSEQSDALKNETDSMAITEANKVIAANTDSCLDNMVLAVILDPNDPRAYKGLAGLYGQQKDLVKSNEWLIRGMAHAKDDVKPELLQQLAYNCIQADKYCEAAPYFSQMLGLMPKDSTVLSTMGDLAICFNSCKYYDSAVRVFHEMLAIQPTNGKALMGIGEYFEELSSSAADSAKKCDSLGNAKEATRWRDVVRHSFYDSARTYFKKVFDTNPNDTAAAKQYGLVCYLLQDWPNTKIAYERATQLDPNNATGWATLGDCFIYLKQTKDAIAPYEKVIGIEPDNQQVLQQLKLLYTQEGMTAKVAEVDAKLAKLKKP